MPTSFPNRCLADVALLHAAHCGLALCAFGHVRPVLGLETVAANIARRHAKRGEHLTGIHRVRHEPAALDMRQILVDQPPRSGPNAVRALTCDALDAPLLPTSWYGMR